MSVNPVSAILHTKSYLLQLLGNVVFTVALNMFIDSAVIEKKLADAHAVSGGELLMWDLTTTPFDCAIFVVLVTSFTFLGSKSTQLVIAREKRGLTQEQLRQSTPRLFHLLFGDKLSRSLPKFLLWTLAIVMPIVVSVALIPCVAMVKGSLSHLQDCTVEEDVTPLVRWTALWKAIATTIIFTANYVGCHNEAALPVLEGGEAATVAKKNS